MGYTLLHEQPLSRDYSPYKTNQVMDVVVLTDRRYVGTDLVKGPVEGYVENVILEDTLVCDALER